MELFRKEFKEYFTKQFFSDFYDMELNSEENSAFYK